MKKIAVLVASVVAMLGLVLTPLAMPAYADDMCTGVEAKYQAACGACAAEGKKWNNNKCDRGGEADLTGIIQTVINVMLFIVGILCVIMIIFGGIRYTTSTGDKGKVDSAKNTIVYAVVGLIVAIVAFAVVQWVFSALT